MVVAAGKTCWNVFVICFDPFMSFVLSVISLYFYIPILVYIV